MALWCSMQFFPHQDKDVTGCKCGIMYAEHTSIIPLAKDRYDKPKDTPQKVSSTQIKALLMNWWLIEEHRPEKQGLMKLWNPALLNSAANTQVLLVHIGNRCFFHLKKVLWNHTKALKQPYEFICAMVTRWTAHTLVIHIYIYIGGGEHIYIYLHTYIIYTYAHIEGWSTIHTLSHANMSEFPFWDKWLYPTHIYIYMIRIYIYIWYVYIYISYADT